MKTFEHGGIVPAKSTPIRIGECCISCTLPPAVMKRLEAIAPVTSSGVGKVSLHINANSTDAVARHATMLGKLRLPR